MAWMGMRSSRQELWDYVSPFETHGHIRKIYTAMHGLENPEEDKIAQIAGAFSQGRMYFESAELAPLGVKPVLLYYGASTLLAGLALTRDARLSSEGVAFKPRANSSPMAKYSLRYRRGHAATLLLGPRRVHFDMSWRRYGMGTSRLCSTVDTNDARPRRIRTDWERSDLSTTDHSSLLPTWCRGPAIPEDCMGRRRSDVALCFALRYGWILGGDQAAYM